MRKGSAPQVMAALRNVVLGLLRLPRVEKLAAALRHYARFPQEALQLMAYNLHPAK